ncbi:nucleotidyltransferase domain-containing protein [Tardiphaga sp.]|uniref:nucleotidyltransferase family protein n=1 Tax=Tardiphaga sp. TaxID=1926292 RepID=UPI0026143187|nr:nucleotidyltransferase domain-containing protein [Tardiphaga sp.]
MAADLTDEQIIRLQGWAASQAAVRELWLFGSRAKGTARPDSDVDIALVLMPANGAHDWALGEFFALASKWKTDLEQLVGRDVSLEAIVPNTPGDAEVRTTGTVLWRRDHQLYGS